MKIIIKNGHVIDPSQNIDDICDILIEDGKIIKIVQKIKSAGSRKLEGWLSSFTKGLNEGGDIAKPLTIDAIGMYVLPGFVDMHVHLREPGFEYKETIRTGTEAAVRGGFTSVCCMPNTKPVNDNSSVTEFIIRRSIQEGFCTVYPIGAITKGQKGEELAELSIMHEAGCIAFSDDGWPVRESLMMRRALEYSKILDVPVISHCEDLSLSSGGVMNEGLLSVTLGLQGIPAQAEEIIVARDISLAELTGARLHIAHISTAGSVELLRRAKKRGIADITAETCPHYFSATEEAVKGYNTNAKVNPPLRTKKDVEAIKKGLAEGTVDVIATDHAPHHSDEKLMEFDRAPSGISGLETAFGLCMKLVDNGVLTLKGLAEKLAVTPAKIMRVKKGTLNPGSDADLVIVDTKKEYRVDASAFRSKGKNTPFDGMSLKGAVVTTICKGKIYKWD